MNYYLCQLETGRDFVFKAYDDYEAAFVAEEESKWFDDYVSNVIQIDEQSYIPNYD